MNGIILYKSKYGATKKYAQWLSEDTGFESREISKVKVSDLSPYDILVFGGGVYAQGVAGVDFLRKNFNALSDRKIIVFCDGASPYEKKAFDFIKNRVMKDELKDIPFFYCRGGWDMEAMSFVDRNLCKMLRKAVAKKDPSEYEVWEAALMAAGEEKCDWTDRAYLKPILEEIESYR
ncbi:MAG: flavodoxin domain-containing protein [Eubacteriales bacterium]|nr:flavodoxin domain-containing protein [Eubacteriales bacterium]